MPPIFHNAFRNSSNEMPLGETAPLQPKPKLRYIVTKQIDIRTESYVQSTASIIIPRDQPQSALLRLPTHIRTIIFEHVFTTNKIIEILPRRAPRSTQHPSPSTVPTNTTTLAKAKHPFPSLLLCRQINTETHLLPFFRNTFYCTNMWDLNLCLTRITAQQRTAIQSLLFRRCTAEGILWEEGGWDSSPNNTSTAAATTSATSTIRTAERVLNYLPALKEIAVDGVGGMEGEGGVLRRDLEGWVRRLGREDVRIVVGGGGNDGSKRVDNKVDKGDWRWKRQFDGRDRSRGGYGVSGGGRGGTVSSFRGRAGVGGGKGPGFVPRILLMLKDGNGRGGGGGEGVRGSGRGRGRGQGRGKRRGKYLG